jgi:hypothetical protein
MIKFIKQKTKNFIYHWSYLGVLNSPLKGLKLNWYFGKIQHGTPYFLPRKWVNCTSDDAYNAWTKLDNQLKEKCIDRWGGFEEYCNHYTKSYTKPVPIKYFSWDSCSLGWKTKWDDYRFEWSPCYSLIIFGKQLFVTVVPKIDKGMVGLDCYWEAWLNWENNTDKTKSKEERLEQLKKVYSCTWGNKTNGYTDYYTLILKEKYLK